MEQSPSQVANSRSANQQILLLLWKPKVPCRVPKSPLLDPESDESQSISSHALSLISVIILLSGGTR
jgi:hypothetical protein